MSTHSRRRERRTEEDSARVRTENQRRYRARLSPERATAAAEQKRVLRALAYRIETSRRKLANVRRRLATARGNGSPASIVRGLQAEEQALANALEAAQEARAERLARPRRRPGRKRKD